MRIEIGHNMEWAGVGDQIILSAVAREARREYPKAEIVLKYTSPQEVVDSIFGGNPDIDKYEWGLLKEPMTDWKDGHMTEKACRYLGFKAKNIHGDIHLTDKELIVAKKTLELLSGDRPVIMAAMNSSTSERDWKEEHWEEIVSMLSEKYDVYQLGQSVLYYQTTTLPPLMQAPVPEYLRGYKKEYLDGMPMVCSTIKGSRQEFRNFGLRKTFALMFVSGKYFGVDTGYMHAASCFGNDNFVFIGSKDSEMWTYPDNKNFFRNEPFQEIKERIKNDWMQ